MIEEPWGESQYILGADSGIQMRVKNQHSTQSIPARFISTPPGVNLCEISQHALVFVVPGQGVYQVDRGIDDGDEPFWIAHVPAHYSEDSAFEHQSDGLYLVTGPLSTGFPIEVSVRNEKIDWVSPGREVEIGAALIGANEVDLTFDAAGKSLRFNGQSATFNAHQKLEGLGVSRLREKFDG